MTSLYILDKQTLFRESLISILSNYSQYNVIGDSDNGDIFIDSLFEKSNRPDILVIDINSLNSLDGYNILSEIKRKRFQIKTLVLSTEVSNSMLRDIFDLNIDGFLLKSCDISEFLIAIEKISLGERYISSKHIHIFNSYILADDFDKRLIDQLSVREIEILKHLANGESNKEIAINLCISESTVKNHIFNIYTKINCTDRTQATIFAFQNNLV